MSTGAPSTGPLRGVAQPLRPVSRSVLRRLYIGTDGLAWEPRDPNTELAVRLIAGGWVRRCDGRCGYERFKDSMLAWTDAAHAALAAGQSPSGQDVDGASPPQTGEGE